MGSKVIRFSNLRERMAPNYIEAFQTEMEMCRKLGFGDETVIVINALLYLDGIYIDSLELVEEEFDNDEVLFKKYRDAIVEFYTYFFDLYGENEEVMAELEAMDVFDDEVEIPTINILADGRIYIKDLNVDFYIEMYEELDEKTKEKIDKLVSHIWNNRCYRQVHVDDEDGHLSTELKTKIPKDMLENAKKVLIFLIMNALELGNPLFVFSADGGTKKLSGFYVKENKIIPCNQDDLLVFLDKQKDDPDFKNTKIEKLNIAF